MTIFEKWAYDWGINLAALSDLQNRLSETKVTTKAGTPEAVTQQAIRLAAPKFKIALWRNNNGACKDENGRQIRYGLANDSAKINKHIKSSDLIGITPVVITPEDVGRTMGLFTSVEVKRSGWKYKGTDREKAQLKWLEIVASMGGISKFATGPEDL